MTDASTPDTAPPPAENAEKSGFMDDLVEVLFAPSAVFARSRNAKFGGAFVVVCVALAALFMIGRPVMRPIIDAQMEKARAKMAQSGTQLTPAQAAMADKVGGVAGVVSGIVIPPIVILVLGLVIWLTGRAFGGSVTAGRGMLIATYCYVPRVLGAAALAVQGFVMNTNNITNLAQVSIGPARFFNPVTTSPILLGVLLRLDLTVLWSTALIAIAYHVAGKMSKGTAYGAAALVWVLGLIPALAGALRGM